MTVERTRPRNLLFLWTDEQRPDTIGAYGNRLIRTPYLDRLARESVVFEQAYCASPVCTPARGTVLTGLYPHTHGALYNDVPLPSHAPTIAELLRSHGYICGYAGKWHLGNELRPQRGFDWWSSLEDIYTRDRDADGYSTYHHWLTARGYTPPDSARDGAKIFGRNTAARLPEAASKPAFLAHEACRFLEERSRGTEPFALYVNFLEPHMPFFGPWDDMYCPGDVPLPKTWYGPPDAGMPLRHRLLREAFANPNPILPVCDEAGWKETVARYWGLASLVDKYVGRILDRLEELGLADNTVVVYTSDHGDMMGEHRLIAKCVQYEGSVRVPLIVRVPGEAATRVTAPVGQVDLVPTLLEALGYEKPPHLQGESLLPQIHASETDFQPRDVVIEWNGWPGAGQNRIAELPWLPINAAHGGDQSEDVRRAFRALAARQRTLRRGRWKFTVDEAGDHELYDLQTDPHETSNLLYAERARCLLADALAAVGELWEGLLAWQEAAGDTVPLADPTAGSRSGASSAVPVVAV